MAPSDASGTTADSTGRATLQGRALIALESNADALIEVGLDACVLLDTTLPVTGRRSNEGIEGVALSPDRRTVFLVHETDRTLLALPRGGSGPAGVLARIRDASSLCDVAYDDRGTGGTGDDRLLLLDRNGRQIFATDLEGRVLGRWRLERKAFGTDPDGRRYSLVALESLAIAAREEDGALLVFAATDPPPGRYPYHRRDREDPGRRYARRVGMLYLFRLPTISADSR